MEPLVLMDGIEPSPKTYKDFNATFTPHEHGRPTQSRTEIYTLGECYPTHWMMGLWWAYPESNRGSAFIRCEVLPLTYTPFVDTIVVELLSCDS
jgi:hypothetical protein